MDVNFNINEHVLVKLTDAGIKHWIKDYNDVFEPIGMTDYLLTKEKILAKRLENGYWKFQFHELMQIFGSLMYIGNTNLPFEADMIIPVKLDRKNKIEKFLEENQ